MYRGMTQRERLLAATWRPGARVRPRRARLRRVAAALAVVVLGVTISGYWFFTQPRRLARAAEAVLADATGGEVTVGRAHFGLLDGLSIGDVELRPPGDEADLPLVSARQVRAEFAWGALLNGRSPLAGLTLIDPQLNVVERADGRWNFSDLRRRRQEPGEPAVLPPDLPRVVLRNGTLRYERPGGTSGEYGVEGQLLPQGDGRYAFAVESRGRRGGVGPTAQGFVDPAANSVAASVTGLGLGDDDVTDILPGVVRDWWQRLGVAGTLDLPAVTWRRDNGAADWSLTARLEGVTLAVPPEIWQSAQETARRDAAAAWARRALPAAVLDGGWVDWLDPEPLTLRRVRGKITFTPESVHIEEIVGRVQGQPLQIDGEVRGYDAGSPAQVRVRTPAGGRLVLPDRPGYVAGLPHQVRDVWRRFRPSGAARLDVTVRRDEPGGRPTVQGELDVLDGSFRLDRLPYPITRATGTIAVDRDPASGEDRVTLIGLRGRGPAGSVNADALVQVDGVIQPLNNVAGFELTVQARDAEVDRRLLASLPPPVQDVLRRFDPTGTLRGLRLRGDLATHLSRPPGRDKRWDIATTVTLRDSAGTFAAFPYPVQDVRGVLEVGRDVALLRDVVVRRGPMAATIDGRIEWGEGVVRPYLDVTASDVPIDDALVNALPPDQRAAVRRLRPAGMLDVTGTIRPGRDVRQPRYDLALQLRDGVLAPVGGSFVVDDLTAKLVVTPESVTFADAAGEAAGGGRVRAEGVLALADPPTLRAEVVATDLALTDALRGDLPETAREAWAWLDVAGWGDVRLSYDGGITPGAGGLAGGADFTAVLEPKAATARPAAMPLAWRDVFGKVTVTPRKVTIDNVSARLDSGATATLSGTGTAADLGEETSTRWLLTATLDNAIVDESFRAGLPEGVREVAEQLGLTGTVWADVRELAVLRRPGADYADVDFDVSLTGENLALDIGLPVTDGAATLRLAGAARDGGVTRLAGDVRARTLDVAGRRARDVRATLVRPEGERRLDVRDLAATFAGGTLGGSASLTLPDEGPQDYTLDLALRDADVRQLAGPAAVADDSITAALTATLSAQGRVGDPLGRRGRGDVRVTGTGDGRMVRLPLVLGLLQVVNLALPVSDGFTAATASYALDNDTLYLENVDIAGGNIALRGGGRLNFASGDVSLTLTADNPGLQSVPIFGDLLAAARNEVVTIRVRGTIEKPEVRAEPLRTFTTTVDEITGG